MNLAGRHQYMNEKNLCHSCLRPNHNDLFCYVNKDGTPKKALPCPRCKNGKYHNSTLCPTNEAEKQAQALNAQHGGVYQGNVNPALGVYSKTNTKP